MEPIKLYLNHKDNPPFDPCKITRQAWNYYAGQANQLAEEIVAIHQRRATGDLAYQEVYEFMLGLYAKRVSILFLAIDPKYSAELKAKLDSEITRLEQRQNVLWELEDNTDDELAKACAKYILLRDQRKILFNE